MTLSEGDRRVLRDVHAGGYTFAKYGSLEPYRDAGLVDYQYSTASAQFGAWVLTAKGQAAIS